MGLRWIFSCDEVVVTGFIAMKEPFQRFLV